MPETLPRRIGFYTLRKHAYAMCKFIPQFSPIISRTFPENAALQAALSAAVAACAVLVAEIDNQATPGV